MQPHTPPPTLPEERILVLAPTGDDAALVSEILRQRGLEVAIIEDVRELAREIEAGAGVAMIATEALGDAHESVLHDVLQRQERWSEMPILLFGGHAEDGAARATELLGTRAQIVLLERPLGIAAFVSATNAALRSRRRQYEVKRLLDALTESAAEIARAHAAATRAKDEFLATLAHELRSPMTAIRGWVQLLKEGELDPEEQATALSMIDTSTRVQSRIVEDLLDVSRILAGKIMIEPQRLALAPLVERLVAGFRPTAAAEGVELIFEPAAEPLFVSADDTRLQQVGWNLLSNAVKFTPRGGSVHVSVARENAMAVIRVRDTGQGISADLLPHIFERYRQEEDDPKKSQHGLGLGLAIVHHLVVSHGGTIEAFSEGPGRGAELVISLPLLD